MQNPHKDTGTHQPEPRWNLANILTALLIIACLVVSAFIVTKANQL